MITKRQCEELLKYEKEPVFCQELSLVGRVLLDKGLIVHLSARKRDGNVHFEQTNHYFITEAGRQALREYLSEAIPGEMEGAPIGNIGFNANRE